MLRREIGDDGGGEIGDVLAALAQRRHAQRDHVEPVEEILAEGAGGDGGAEIAVGRGDDPRVGPPRLGVAHAHVLVLLEQPQELALGLAREIADLVEEERPRARGLHVPDARASAPVNARARARRARSRSARARSPRS